MTAPAIILLNGSTSAGKSTLARALQRRLDRQPVVTGLDTFVVYFSKASDGAVAVNAFDRLRG